MNGQCKYTFADYVRINQNFSSEMFLSVIVTLQQKITCSSNFYTYFQNYRRLLNNTKSSPMAASSDAQTCYTTPRNCENSNKSSSIFEINTNSNKGANSSKLPIEEKEGFSNAIIEANKVKDLTESYTPTTRIHSVEQLK